MRDRVNRVFDAANDVLISRNLPIRIDVRRWEKHAPDRHTTNVNDRFVEEAQRSHLVLALLLDELRAGTEEELTAVLERTEHRISLIRFRRARDEPTPELAAFLEAHRNRLLYAEVGSPGGEKAWLTLMSLVVDFCMSILKAETDQSLNPFYDYY